MNRTIKTTVNLLLGFILCLLSTISVDFVQAETTSVPELPMSQSADWEGLGHWLETNLSTPGAVPFSFRYDDKDSREFLAGWDFVTTEKRLDATRTLRVHKYVDPQSGLEVRCEATLFKNHPAVEWVLRFRNTEGRTTPIISDVQALDTVLSNPTGDCQLHYSSGAREGVAATLDDFSPKRRTLASNSTLKFSPLHGRSSWGESLPFFNLDMSERGVILGIGWTGQWHADFTRHSNALNLRAGMEQTHLKLYPGEEIRTPRILLLFWQGHRIYGQNLFRRIVLSHYYPQVDGKPMTMPFITSSAAIYHEAFDATEENQIEFAKHFKEMGLEYVWMDVGWHDPKVGPTHIGPIDRERFPNGFKSLTDALKELEMGLLVWFAPEYQGSGSWLEQERPEWFLKLKDSNDKTYLYNFADQDAVSCITDHLSTMITKGGIGIFRQDGPAGANFKYQQPLQWWRDADPPDRQGMTEIRYVQGLYWFWDELRRRNPGLIIDMCGGGATRIDLEAMSRCVYLWRSDYDHPGFEPNGYQCHTFGLSQWLPSTSTASGYPEPYSFRSSMNAGMALAWNPYQPQVTQRWPLAFPVEQKAPYELKTVPRETVMGERIGYQVSEPFPKEIALRLTQEFKRIRPFFYGDFYPLTPFRIDLDTWLAYQFHKEDLDQGIVLAFRRPECQVATLSVMLWGLSEEATYEVHFEDSGLKRRIKGKELAAGLQLTSESQPGSLLITYRRVR